MSELKGGYDLVDLPYLRNKANADDPRTIFYRAMIQCFTYEAYLAMVGAVIVSIPNYANGTVNGRDEILYCRRNGKIRDAGPGGWLIRGGIQ